MVVLSKFIGESSSSSTNDHKYDVFLSFRGVDTRNSFTDHLHKALVDANICTFLDDDEIETGGDLKPELERAIKESRASIIVFSKNYANSSWCLDELVLILEERMASNQIVIPIFYHVEPAHVRRQQSSFGDAMSKHKQAMETETKASKRIDLAQKIDRWKKALTEVSYLKGMDVNGRRETEFIEEIVKDIYRRLRISSRIPPPQLIGMDSSKKFVTSWLKDTSSNSTDILTILGMAGIGKTSLAKYVYGFHSHEFDRSSFIEDISRRCDEKFNGLLDLQKQLCDDISKTSSIPVHDVSIHTSMIENAVVRKKVFLVLDAIDRLEELDALLGSKGFHPGSKIIITTKNAWLTESCALFKANVKPNHEKHLLQGLHEDESRKLLCLHAFISSNPMEGYEEVSEKLVKYCEGHPLALEVLGKSLHNRDITHWDGCIERLKKDTGSRINNVLRMSFNALSADDKELFKHIACFFVGTDRDVTQTILEGCGIETRFGITNLIDRCLLRIGWNNNLMMHQLLQDMGRLEVLQESPDKPWKRSRVWCHEDSVKVLTHKKGKENIRGLTLDMRMLKNKKLRETFELETDSLSKMTNLMLLQLNFVKTINGSYAKFPEELRWLCMHGFPFKYIPSDLQMEQLVALDMSYSDVESFGFCYSNPQRSQKRQKQFLGSCSKEKRLLGSLKILNLSFCEKLYSLCGFDGLPMLERLIVTNCIRLVEVCELIEACAELVLIDLRYCKKLKKLPRTIDKLEKVQTILLDGCSLGESQIEIRGMDSSEILKNNNININTKTSSSAVIKAIPSYSKFFPVSLPRSLVILSLACNNLSTESFPMDFSCLSMLKELYLDENHIVSMPDCVRGLPRLELLSMSGCRMLVSVEHTPHTLKCLDLESYSKPLLRKVVFDPQMSPLSLSVAWDLLAPASFEIEGMVKIQPMAGVEGKVLSSLGWTNLGILNEKRVATFFVNRESEEYEIQMYYEFGIFSTIYAGEEIPNWITERSKGPSISFTIPSSPNNLRGLNFCFVQIFQCNGFFRRTSPDHQFLILPVIIISNITKNRTWKYDHCLNNVSVDEECLIMLSHWMFGMSEMEAGDQVTITVTKNLGLTKECGVSLVYDDGKTDEEKEDVLGYYKSWNHIIGGDLTGFQTTTGEYALNIKRFMSHGIEVLPYYREFVGDGAKYKEEVGFRALSTQRKIDILDHTRRYTF